MNQGGRKEWMLQTILACIFCSCKLILVLISYPKGRVTLCPWNGWEVTFLKGKSTSNFQAVISRIEKIFCSYWYLIVISSKIILVTKWQSFEKHILSFFECQSKGQERWLSSSSGPGFVYQHPHGGPQSSATPDPGYLTLFLNSTGTRHVHGIQTYIQDKYSCA